jgi:hypothetical protein
VNRILQELYVERYPTKLGTAEEKQQFDDFMNGEEIDVEATKAHIRRGLLDIINAGVEQHAQPPDTLISTFTPPVDNDVDYASLRRLATGQSPAPIYADGDGTPVFE